MTFVLDASVTATWMYKDEEHEDAAYAYELLRTDVAVVPAVWWFEVRNLLITGERRRRFTRAEANTLRRDLNTFPVEIDRDPEEGSIFDLARRHNLTFYDASYLALALRRRAPLATLDRVLIAAARAEGVDLVGHG